MLLWSSHQRILLGELREGTVWLSPRVHTALLYRPLGLRTFRNLEVQASILIASELVYRLVKVRKRYCASELKCTCASSPCSTALKTPQHRLVHPALQLTAQLMYHSMTLPRTPKCHYCQWHQRASQACLLPLRVHLSACEGPLIARDRSSEPGSALDQASGRLLERQPRPAGPSRNLFPAAAPSA